MSECTTLNTFMNASSIRKQVRVITLKVPGVIARRSRSNLTVVQHNYGEIAAPACAPCLRRSAVGRLSAPVCVPRTGRRRQAPFGRSQ